MDEQEKKRETASCKEQLTKALESLNATPLPSDTDPTSPFWVMRPAPDRFKKNSSEHSP